jgi:hypothetical protein
MIMPFAIESRGLLDPKSDKPELSPLSHLPMRRVLALLRNKAQLSAKDIGEPTARRIQKL